MLKAPWSSSALTIYVPQQCHLYFFPFLCASKIYVLSIPYLRGLWSLNILSCTANQDAHVISSLTKTWSQPFKCQFPISDHAYSAFLCLRSGYRTLLEKDTGQECTWWYHLVSLEVDGNFTLLIWLKVMGLWRAKLSSQPWGHSVLHGDIIIILN